MDDRWVVHTSRKYTARFVNANAFACRCGHGARGPTTNTTSICEGTQGETRAQHRTSTREPRANGEMPGGMTSAGGTAPFSRPPLMPGKKRKPDLPEVPLDLSGSGSDADDDVDAPVPASFPATIVWWGPVGGGGLGLAVPTCVCSSRAAPCACGSPLRPQASWQSRCWRWTPRCRAPACAARCPLTAPTS